MFLNPEVMRRMAEINIRDRLREAEHDRLVRLAEGRRPGQWPSMGGRLVRRLGRLLIETGMRLDRDPGSLPRGT
jgi:hypothetical protein